MGDSRVGRFRKHFRVYVYQNIAACLNERQGVGATILTCCAIDTLAKFASAGSAVKANRDCYTSFVAKYFPPSYDAQDFYTFVRCGLVHSFDMEKKYVILSVKEPWAQELHMRRLPNRKRTIINPYVLFRHLKLAHLKLADDLDADRDLRKRFVRVYQRTPVRPQNYRKDQVIGWLQSYAGADSDQKGGRARVVAG